MSEKMFVMDDLFNLLNEYTYKSDSERNKNLHLSNLSICGFKYRNEIENKSESPYRLAYDLGNAFENIITYKVKKTDEKRFTKQKIVTLIRDEQTFIGHIDMYDELNNVVYELKCSKSNNYNDIYRRQLYSYAYLLNADSVLWHYNYITNKFTENIFEIDDIKGIAETNLTKQLDAFNNNKYVEGIENSLCLFCSNANCIKSSRYKGDF